MKNLWISTLIVLLFILGVYSEGTAKKWNWDTFKTANSEHHPDPIFVLPEGNFGGWEDLESYTGYIDIEGRKGGKLFYWFVGAPENPEQKPLMLWLNGGPGCASMIGMFEQNGPFRCEPIDKVTKIKKIKKFDQSWIHHANMLYIDQPVGAGYSIVDDSTNNGAKSATEAAIDLIKFFKIWLEIKVGNKAIFSKFKNRDFYVAGESYAGKYIPSLMYEFDKPETKLPLNWVGTLIGNGMMKPTIQYNVYADHAYAFGIHFEKDYINMTKSFSICHQRVKDKLFDQETEDYCQGPFSHLLKSSGGLDPFDVRQSKEDLKQVSNIYLSDFQIFKKIRDELGIQKRVFNTTDPDLKYHRCNTQISKAFRNSGDKHQDLSDEVISHLLDHPTRKLLIYSGQFDLRVDALGTSELLRIFPWKNQQLLNAQYPVQIKSENHVVGHASQAGNVSFMIIYGASHLTDEFHPKATLQMVERFIKNPDGGVCKSGTCKATKIGGDDQDSCMNSCSSKGDCQKGTCKCFKNYMGKDCSLYVDNKFDQDALQLKKLKVAGRSVQLYWLKLTYRLQPLMKVDIALNITSGSPMPFLNLTDTVPDSRELLQNQFKYNVERLRHHSNWDASLLNFRFANLSRPSMTLDSNTFRSHLTGNLVLSSFKDNYITIGIYNDHDGDAEFDLSMVMTPSETFLPHYWFFFGASAVLVPVALALFLLIVRQSRQKFKMDNAAPYTSLIDGKAPDSEHHDSLIDSDDDLEMANYSHT
mmetsp:Transcript_10802/g.15819  ORF Transcript_10802/g.15819 Transcript_10802/m.15819 type:complete len:754 (+) Transcript_10802:34-2295(+)